MIQELKKIATQPKVQKVAFALKIIFAFFILYRVFLLDIFAVTTNDSLTYLLQGASEFFFEKPISIIQPRGFKFAGYPIFISIIQILNFSSLDLMTTLALFQRVLLAAGLVWLIFDLGLVSIPIAIFLSSAHIVAQSNLILTEGLSVPLGIFFSIAAVNVWRKSEEKVLGLGFWLYFINAAAAYLALILIKITYVVYGLVFLPSAVVFEFSKYSINVKARPLARMIFPMLALAGLYVIIICVDNFKTFNQFSPVMGKEQARYWGYWHQIFTEYPENKHRPELKEYYSNGNLYTYMHSVRKSCGEDVLVDPKNMIKQQNYICSEPILRKRSNEMLNQANLFFLNEWGKVFFSALFGGGKLETESILKLILRQNGMDNYDLDRMSRNPYIKYIGLETFLAEVNGGKKPRTLTGLSRAPLIADSYRASEAGLTIIEIVAFFYLITSGRAGANTPYSLIVVSYLIFVISLSIYFADIWRYIITPWTIFAIVIGYGISDILATASLERLWGKLRLAGGNQHRD